MAKIKIGDIIEIPTKKGYFYGQYTHENEEFSSLIRVFDFASKGKIRNFEEVVKSPVKYTFFFPLKAAVRKKIFQIVGNNSCDSFSKDLPIFKNPMTDRDGKVHSWWLWDGNDEWPIKRLGEKEKKYPLLEIWTDLLLIERLNNDWKEDYNNPDL